MGDRQDDAKAALGGDLLELALLEDLVSDARFARPGALPLPPAVLRALGDDRVGLEEGGSERLDKGLPHELANTDRTIRTVRARDEGLASVDNANVLPAEADRTGEGAVVRGSLDVQRAATFAKAEAAPVTARVATLGVGGREEGNNENNGTQLHLVRRTGAD